VVFLTNVLHAAATPPIATPSVNYGAIAAPLIILGAACVSVLFEAFLPRQSRWAAQVTLSLLALIVAGLALGLYIKGAPSGGTTTL